MTPSDRNVAFFRPLWRRVVLVAVLAVWTAVEILYGDRTWAWITGAILAYSVWAYVLRFPAEEDERPR